MKNEKVFSSFEDMAKAIGELPTECSPLTDTKTLNKSKQIEPKPQRVITPSPIMQKDNPKLKPIKVEGELIKITCVDCDFTFFISPNEAKFYTDKGYDLPKRCKTCRAKKKAERENLNWDSLQ